MKKLVWALLITIYVVMVQGCAISEPVKHQDGVKPMNSHQSHEADAAKETE